MTRWALRIAVAAALLLVLYAAAGWFLAPRYVRGALAEEAAARGLELRLARVRTHPFGLSVELEGIELTGPEGRRASAQAIAADLAWASLWRDAWIVERVDVQSPVVDLRANAAAGAGGVEGKRVLVRRLSLADGTLRLPGQVTLEQVRASLQDLSTAPGTEPAAYQASATPASGGSLRSQGMLSLAPLSARGTIQAQAVALAEVWRLAAPGTQAVPGAIGGTAAYTYGKGRLAFDEIALRAEPEAGGSATASGTWDVAANRGRLALRAEALPASLAQGFLPRAADVRIAAGTFSSDGVLELAEGFGYTGSLRILNLRLEENDGERLLLAWREARTPALRFTRDALLLGEIEAEAPEARLVVQDGGRLNFAVAFAGGQGEGGSLRVAFDRLQVREGTLHFADRTLDNPFETTVVALAGTVSSFSTAAGDPAKVQLNGRVPPYGTARIRGTLDPGAPTSLARITARLRNLRLEAFNPYITKFAGYRIASGKVSAELHYELKSGRLVGDNDLVFEEMRLGEKVASAGALDLPLELAVALLADAKGRITLDIPVSGNLRDPKFEFGAIVARAVGNTLRRIVSAPFRALASIVGGGGDRLGGIAFAPGRAELSPPAQEDVARIAGALAARPRLAVAVHAGYDPDRDLRALRLRAAGDEIAARAGVDARGPLDFDDGKVRRAAEQVFLRGGGTREALRELRRTEGNYGRALMRRIAEALPLGKTAVDILAQARAESVRAALLEHGVDAERVRIDASRAEAAGDDGVPTQLALRAGGSAAAGH